MEKVEQMKQGFEKQQEVRRGQGKRQRTEALERTSWEKKVGWQMEVTEKEGERKRERRVEDI